MKVFPIKIVYVILIAAQLILNYHRQFVSLKNHLINFFSNLNYEISNGSCAKGGRKEWVLLTKVNKIFSEEMQWGELFEVSLLLRKRRTLFKTEKRFFICLLRSESTHFGCKMTFPSTLPSLIIKATRAKTFETTKSGIRDILWW